MDNELKVKLLNISDEIFDVYDEKVFTKEKINIDDIFSYLREVSAGLSAISIPIYGMLLKQADELMDLSDSEYLEFKSFVKKNLREVANITCNETFKCIERLKKLNKQNNNG